jgi:DNA polymerase-3 subunit delta'
MAHRLDFPGNERVRRQLERALDAGRLAGAYLFEGAPGAGQEQAAVALAAAAITGREDPDHPESRRVHRYAHPDLHYLLPLTRGRKPWGEMTESELLGLFLEQQGRKGEDPWHLPRHDKAPHLPIEAVRLVMGILATRPFEGRRKAVIIRDADLMRADAQDTLLKSLEEPPPASLLILVSFRPEALRPTILSRCQRLPFDPLDPATVSALLRARGLDAARADLLATLSEGNAEQAVMLAAAESEEGNALLERREAWLETIDTCEFGSELEMMDAVQALTKRREGGNPTQARADFLSLAISWYREVLRCGLAGEPPRVHVDQERRLRRHAGQAPEALAERIQRCEKARGQILANANADLTLLSLFFSFRTGSAARTAP